MMTTRERRPRRRRPRGSITAKGPDRWLVRVSYGVDEQGRQRRQSEVVGGAKKDAERRLVELLKEQDDRPELAPSSQTVAGRVAYWFTQLTGDLSPQTVSKYRYAWDRYGEGTALAGARLATLTPQAVQTFVNDLGKRVGPVTVHYVARWLKAVLNQAVATGELARNPMTQGKVKLPRIPKPEYHRLTFAEARRFLTAAEQDRYGALWRVWLEAGFRPNEATALRWEDWDAKAGVLHVRRALVRIGKVVSFQETKTGATRAIPLSKATRKTLQAHRKRQLAERVELGPYWQGRGEYDGLMFPSVGGTPLAIANLDRRHFKPLLRAAKLPTMRLYDLRHSSATLLLKSGASLKDVQTRLGHARATLTLDTYLESDTETQISATAKLTAALAG
jgi:integrase